MNNDKHLFVAVEMFSKQLVKYSYISLTEFILESFSSKTFFSLI